MYLEDDSTVVLIVRSQQRLQDDVIIGDAPSVQVADQYLHDTHAVLWSNAACSMFTDDSRAPDRLVSHTRSCMKSSTGASSSHHDFNPARDMTGAEANKQHEI